MIVVEWVKRAVLVGLSCALVLAGAGVWSWQRMGDVPRGVRVLGVDLGGLSRSEAERKLGEHLAAWVGGPARIRLDGRDLVLDAAALHLRIDVDLSVGRAIRADRPDVAPVVRLNRGRLEKELRARLPAGRVTMRRPGITFAGLRPWPSYPEPGLDLDPRVAARAVKAAWPVGGVAEVPLVRRTPVTTAAGVDALIAALARPAVAAPVTIRLGGRVVGLTPYAISQVLIFRASNAGRLTAVIDGARLPAAVRIDLDRLGPALLAVLARPAPRVVTA
jgi:hypothetical protein